MCRIVLALALAIELPPLVDEDVLEPSIQNEADHALSLARAAAPAPAAAPDTSPASPAPAEPLGPQSPAGRPPRDASQEPSPVATSPAPPLPFDTNGLSRTEIAIRLVSAQKADGRWYSGTNDVTSAAVEILESL